MRTLPVLALSVSMLALACGKAERQAPAGAARNDTAKEVAPGRKALLEIRAELAVDVESTRDAAELAGKLGELATGASGFVELSNVEEGGAHVVLRIPPDRIDAVRALLVGRGPLARETRTARDVTDAVADVDARVRAAKLEETRLLDLLANKTGTLADVLAVEKVLGEVRDRIERLEAEQRAAHGRVDLAVVDVRATVRGFADGAPVSHRLAIAGREGVALAREAAIGTATTALRAGPTLLPIAGVGALVVFLLRRNRSRSIVAGR
ncbi:MAG: DUF4349 domain-containing protein [Deltaproteobacteria bacterium]|nr:DUF4349 domain-containing protein [Deltaproteobacteria bacterium]